MGPRPPEEAIAPDLVKDDHTRESINVISIPSNISVVFGPIESLFLNVADAAFQNTVFELKITRLDRSRTLSEYFDIYYPSLKQYTETQGIVSNGKNYLINSTKIRELLFLDDGKSLEKPILFLLDSFIEVNGKTYSFDFKDTYNKSAFEFMLSLDPSFDDFDEFYVIGDNDKCIFKASVDSSQTVAGLFRVNPPHSIQIRRSGLSFILTGAEAGGELDSQVIDELKRYRAIGAAYINYSDQNLKEIKHTLLLKPRDVFMFISGSSGSGKTQLLYILDAFAKYGMKLSDDTEKVHNINAVFLCVLHFVLGGDLHAEQKIYLSNSGVSMSLSEAIKSDEKKFKITLLSYLVELSKMASRDSNLEAEWKYAEEVLGLHSADLLGLSAKDISNVIQRRMDKCSNLTSGTFIEMVKNRMKWKVFGFLVALIKSRMRFDPLDRQLIVTVEPLLFMEANEKIIELSNGKPILVCLDEFVVANRMTWDRNIFIRNLFMQLAIFPILLGTNASAANIISDLSLGNHSRLDEEKIWSFIVLKLPQLLPSSLVIPDRLFAVNPDIMAWIKAAIPDKGLYFCSKPGIVKTFLQTLTQNVEEHAPVDASFLLDLYFQNTLSSLAQGKLSLRSPKVALAYFLMYFSRYREQYDDIDACYAPFLINRHYAELLPNPSFRRCDLPAVATLRRNKKVTIEWGSEDKKAVSTKIFDPHSIFPLIDYNELSHMVFSSDWNTVLVHPDLKSVLNLVATEHDNPNNKHDLLNHCLHAEYSIFSFSFRMIAEISYDMAFKSSNYQKGKGKRNGDRLEVIALGSFVKAASMQTSGTPLSDFLPRMVAELSMFKYHDIRLSDDIIGMLPNELCFQKVPYVVAMNYLPSEDFRCIPGVYCGFMGDFNDGSQYDGRCSPAWADTLYDNSQDNSPSAKIVEVEKENSNRANCLMYLTFECKNYDLELDFSTFVGIIRRVAERSRKYRGQQPFKKELKHHVHFVFTTFLKSFKCTNELQKSCGHFCDLYEMTFDDQHVINLRNMFLQDPNGESEETKEGEEVRPKKPRLAKDVSMQAVMEVAQNDVSESVTLKTLRNLGKKTAAPANFPKSTIIIVPLETMFKYRLTGVENLSLHMLRLDQDPFDIRDDAIQNE